MHWSGVVRARVTLGAGLAMGVLLLLTSTLTRGNSNSGAAYALDATPPPMPAPAVAPSPASITVPPSGGPAATPRTSDLIAAVAEQVAQVAHDPVKLVEEKTTQIYALASQFNQLVAQWQQENFPGGVASTPTPGATPVATADQLRAHIAEVVRQMAQVSQDPSLSVDARTAQLNSLSSQFNQLTIQLQQHGD